MGYNTPVLLLNDALHEIASDPEFGKNVAAASPRAYMLGHHVDVSCNGHANAATVYPSAHADIVQVMAFGGNHATTLARIYNGGRHYTQDERIQLLKDLAGEFGYRLVRKSGTPVG